MKKEKREYDTTYIDGNTVRQAEVLPDRYQEKIQRERQKQQVKNRKLARHNQEREMRMNRGHLVFSTAALAVTCLICAAYIQVQSQVTTRMEHIATLEREIADLKTDNDTTLKRINTSIDLNKIKAEAMGKLGMVYANENQVIYYDIEDTDFMTQYEEIPER